MGAPAHALRTCTLCAHPHCACAGMCVARAAQALVLLAYVPLGCLQMQHVNVQTSTAMSVLCPCKPELARHVQESLSLADNGADTTSPDVSQTAMSDAAQAELAARERLSDMLHQAGLPRDKYTYAAHTARPNACMLLVDPQVSVHASHCVQAHGLMGSKCTLNCVWGASLMPLCAAGPWRCQKICCQS